MSPEAAYLPKYARIERALREQDARAPVGSPLLVERRVIDDADGRRLESTESRYPADRYGIDGPFDVERPDLGAAGETDGRPIQSGR